MSSNFTSTGNNIFQIGTGGAGKGNQNIFSVNSNKTETNKSFLPNTNVITSNNNIFQLPNTTVNNPSTTSNPASFPNPFAASQQQQQQPINKNTLPVQNPFTITQPKPQQPQSQTSNIFSVNPTNPPNSNITNPFAPNPPSTTTNPPSSYSTNIFNTKPPEQPKTAITQEVPPKTQNTNPKPPTTTSNTTETNPTQNTSKPQQPPKTQQKPQQPKDLNDLIINTLHKTQIETSFTNWKTELEIQNIRYNSLVSQLRTFEQKFLSCIDIVSPLSSLIDQIKLESSTTKTELIEISKEQDELLSQLDTLEKSLKLIQSETTTSLNSNTTQSLNTNIINDQPPLDNLYKEMNSISSQLDDISQLIDSHNSSTSNNNNNVISTYTENDNDIDINTALNSLYNDLRKIQLTEQVLAMKIYRLEKDIEHKPTEYTP